MNQLRRLRDAAIVVALLALPFLVLNAHLKDPSKVGFVDELLLDATAPVQHAARAAAAVSSEWLQHYFWLVEVASDNDRLRADNERLRAEVRALRLEARENVRLRKLLGLRQKLRGETLAAQVVAKEMAPFPRVVRIRLDRGERDRVRPGMPVVAAAGLVGQVRRTWGRYSDVLLLVDRASKIDVVVPRTGARGILRGTGESDRYACRIEYVQRDAEVQVGDEVYTSGLGKLFPPGILVGRISRVARRDYGLYQQVEVLPAVNFSALQEVLVLLEGPLSTRHPEARP